MQGPPFHTIIHSSPAAATSIELVNAHLKGSQISLGFFHMLSMSSSHVSPQYQAAAWREKPCSSRFQCAETFDCFNHVLVQCFSNFHISRSLLNSDSVQMEPNGPVRVHLVPFVHCQSYRLVWVNLNPLKLKLRNPHAESLESSLGNPVLQHWVCVSL